LLAAVRAGERLGPVVQHRMPSSQWRRYDKCGGSPTACWPAATRYVASIRSMGKECRWAALDAVALRDCPCRGVTDLPRRYFRATAKAIGLAWRTGASPGCATESVNQRCASFHFGVSHLVCISSPNHEFPYRGNAGLTGRDSHRLLGNAWLRSPNRSITTPQANSPSSPNIRSTRCSTSNRPFNPATGRRLPGIDQLNSQRVRQRWQARGAACPAPVPAASGPHSVVIDRGDHPAPACEPPLPPTTSRPALAKAT
jgi:hypothetical protein